MALINCPECGKEISDKSKQCIHCGFPLDNMFSNDSVLYDMVYIGTAYKYDEGYMIAILKDLYGIPKSEGRKMITTPNSVIITGIEKKNIEYLKTSFEEEGYIMDFVKSNSKNINPINTKISKWDAEWREKQRNAIKCPTCGSTNTQKISTTSKVVGVATFGLFSKTARSQFKCNHCGYKW